MAEHKDKELASSLQAVSISDNPKRKVAAHPSSIPATLTRSFTVKSVPTDAWVQIFADRTVIGISQLDGKVGNYLLCQATSSEVNPRAVDYNVTNLLGAREDPLLAVYARRVTEQIVAMRPPTSAEPLPTVILAVSLHKEKGKDPAMFGLLVDLLVQLYRDAVSGSY